MCFMASVDSLDCYLHYYTIIFTIPYLFFAVMAIYSTPIPAIGEQVQIHALFFASDRYRPNTLDCCVQDGRTQLFKSGLSIS